MAEDAYKPLPAWPLVGERAPDFQRPMLTQDTGLVSVVSPFECIAGHASVMAAADGTAAAALAARLGDVLVPDQPCFLVTNLPPEQLGAVLEALSPPRTRAKRLVFSDRGPLVGFLLGQGAQSAAVWALDPTGRILSVCTDPLGKSGLERCLETLPLEPTLGTMPAPVLLIPDVLEPALCERLVALHAAENKISGMPRVVNGETKLVTDIAAKSRHDHPLTSKAASRAVMERLRRRVLPEIQRSFQFAVTQMEGFKIAAYHAPGPDSPGGWFRPHRDNTAPSVAHRRFALTLNLDDDYEGGGLVLPEFGPTAYRPPAGGALVFSCSHLHEATDVTRGTRHVLLTFLFDDAALARSKAAGTRG